jgi:hypothetical protein
MKGGKVKWVLIGVAALLIAFFALAVTAVVVYQLLLAPDRTPRRGDTMTAPPPVLRHA